MTTAPRTGWLAPIIAAGAVTLAAAPAAAAEISITGGFTNFYTTFAYGLDANLPGTIFSYVNGQQLCPMNLTGNPANDCRVDGEAYQDFATPVPSVSFKMVVDGNTWTENVVSFTPAVNQVVNGFGPTNKFLMGTLAFTNGVWSSDRVNLSFNLTATSPDPAYSGYDFEVSDVLVMKATANSPANTPAQNADYLYVAGLPQLGSVRAYELADSPSGSNTVIVDVYGYLDSLHLGDFRNARGGGFIDASVEAQPVSQVPVPAAGWLVATAAGLVAPWMRRRAG